MFSDAAAPAFVASTVTFSTPLDVPMNRPKLFDRLHVPLFSPTKFVAMSYPSAYRPNVLSVVPFVLTIQLACSPVPLRPIFTNFSDPTPVLVPTLFVTLLLFVAYSALTPLRQPYIVTALTGPADTSLSAAVFVVHG